jgi:hypothetical protein
MGTAVAVHEAERPGWIEILSVLATCAVLLVVLGTLDDRAARREAARARTVLDERATKAGERASREAMTAPRASPRPDRLGRDHSPIVIPAGPAWGPGTSVVSHTQEARRAPTPVPLRRIEGRATAGYEAEAAPVEATGNGGGTAIWDGSGPVLLILMAGAGVSMSAAGIRMLSRRSA